ncbi:polyphosphate kinase 2 [Phenylobacterium deserti]|uniref:ADP/GDP-polyphosphate phosphotransferase n=1 Tax=Phenylobacterium deserti TaxID=1914756 RepID=A0A328AP67_9CAUL|nr:polyphosphate kinase 2 [Phenylobacterium deserti]RAK56783.1 polyphosphate kinase 2 [Phenylobacterium deserti]
MAHHDDGSYQQELEARQLALVRWQQRAMTGGEKVLIIFEGRDAAGKDGSIRVITEHLSVRNTRVVALPKPSDREKSQWFFQRYTAFLPSCGETAIFNRSWYNRAGVERVMGFSSPEEQEVFLRDVPTFETMLAESGLKIVKLWLDVSKDEQAQRLEERRTDPLKVLKTSPLDEVAQSKWDAYSVARDEMLRRTSTQAAPWICVRSDRKKRARLAILSHLVKTLAPAEIAETVSSPDPDVLFPFEISALTDGRLER